MSGTLLIVGGGTNASADEIFSKLIEKAGGPDSKIAFIVTASGEDPDELFRSYEEDLYRLGLKRGHCVLVPIYAQHCVDERGYNAMTGDCEGLCDYLDGVTGVWFTGGDQYFTWQCLIRKDGSDTALLARLRKLYEDGGVIGGSSAGAAIMSRVMICNGTNRSIFWKDTVFGYDDYDAIAEEDDSCSELIISQGLGFYPHGIVDQHFNTRPRLLRTIETCMINKENTRVAFAVSEDTAMVYHEGRFDVIGSAGVYVIDCRNAVRTAPGCYRGVVLHAVHRGESFDPVGMKAFLAGNIVNEESYATPDYISGGIIDNPMFDQMMEKRVLRGRRDSLYFDEEKQLPYAKGAAAYDIHGKTAFVSLKYYRRPDTEGIRNVHTSFTNVEVDIDSTVF